MSQAGRSPFAENDVQDAVLPPAGRAAVAPEPVAPPDRLDPGLPGVLEAVLERVRLRARRRLTWLSHLLEAARTDGVETPRLAGITAALEDLDSPAAETAWYAAEPLLAPLNAAIAEVERTLADDAFPKDETGAAGTASEQAPSRLGLLRRLFGLSAQDMDVVQVCLAQALDPALAQVFAYLQDSAGHAFVTEELVARLFGHGRCCLWSAESPLRRWELVVERETAPGAPPMLSCDRQLRDWLLGQNDLDEALVGIARLQLPLAPLDGWPIGETSVFISRVLEAGEAGAGGGRSQVRVRVSGGPGSGRRTLAACVSARLGLPLLAIDADAVDEADWRVVFLHAQRQAFLDRCALAWYGEAILRRPWPLTTPHFPLQFVICESGQAPPALSGTVEYAVEMPHASVAERRRLWQQYLPAAVTWPAEALDALAGGHHAGPGVIAEVARHGDLGPERAAGLLREAQRGQLGRLARPLERPFTWDDLVVPDDLREALADLAYEAQARITFWERPAARRLFPQGRGLVGLFAGSPGTGKTMAAQVISAGLGLDLLRIDLSAVVSKYVGETSQNLERILSRAAGMDVVLLFDEADALFGKRTEIKDAHDRFANTDTNYLLQAIEDYPGIALLASNRKNNLDPAFIRRIRYVLDFPRPDAAQRLRIWRQVLGELCGPEQLAALAGGLEGLAREVEATGAQIKFAVLAAVFAAQRGGEPVGLPHLLRGLDRELIKEGRALSDRERARIA